MNISLTIVRDKRMLSLQAPAMTIHRYLFRTFAITLSGFKTLTALITRFGVSGIVVPS
ncbi:MAG TPA: hypothetical protein PLA96_08480 [Candidatus Brocadia sapporoensis]|uniref:hypothetical protein n=1 Tax=Candidatus Brocadia sapporoensis TaxID=392547 RepID=UPI0015C4B245|nr:hypothetical protein [Candidatus Brocadia sapporoensis]HQU31511.1 hypothetical protein [Candidatus Brocadia sapporoensis]